MSTSASRRHRSARNALIEALGLGETHPLRDLPVSEEPPMVPFGGSAVISVEDSERGVAYRLLDQSGQPLPGGTAPEAVGNGARLTIETPAITEDVTYTVRAARPNGRNALLQGTAPVKVGLDATLPVTAVSAGGPPILIDHGARLRIEVAASQEGVTYRLVARPSPDPAAPDDLDAVATDIALSDAAGVGGTGATIGLASLPLVDDTLIHVRAIRVFGGSNPRPPQATLLTTRVPVFIRADTALALRAAPAVVDHGAATNIEVEASQPGVAYALHARPIADAEFSRVEPADPATIAVPTDGGELRIVTPPTTTVWEAAEGFEPLGDAVVGTGATLALPVPARTADTMLLVEARKTHSDGAFGSAERLDRVAAVLVRPDQSPGLRLEAVVVGGKLTGLGALAGQSGVFYGLSTGATALGELYLHQRDPAEAALNKGIEALAVMVDLVVAEGGIERPTSMAPQPLPRLDVAELALPLMLRIVARRAMTGLTAELGTVAIAPLPPSDPQPPEVASGDSAQVTITGPVADERYALLLNGRRLAEPVPGRGATLTLGTGVLAAGDRVELWAGTGAAGAAVSVERRMPLGIRVG